MYRTTFSRNVLYLLNFWVLNACGQLLYPISISAGPWNTVIIIRVYRHIIGVMVHEYNLSASVLLHSKYI